MNKRRIFSLILSFQIFLFCKAEAQDSSLTNQIKQYITFLSSDSLKGRFAGSFTGHIASQYIAAEMKAAGLKPISGFDNFFNPFLYKKDTLKNIIGAIQGSALPDEIIVFSAHYDHVGTMSTNPYPDFHSFNTKDSIYNGANDDASGVASILALANLIKKDNIQPLQTVVFIAFDGEELGEVGSNFLVDYFDPGKVYAVINLEMLGIASYGSPFITGDRFSNLREMLNSNLYQANSALYGKHYFRPDNDLAQNLFSRSDNFPFAKRKMIAHTIMATDPSNQFYHSVKDEAATLDYKFMTNAVTAIYLAVKPLLTNNIKLKTHL